MTDLDGLDEALSGTPDSVVEEAGEAFEYDCGPTNHEIGTLAYEDEDY